jgi:ribosomal protein S18 acetylase RimI-like enzyme
MSGEADFIIREARSSDRVKIGALWRELMALHRSLDPRFVVTPDGEQKYLRHIQDILHSRDARVLVAEERAGKTVIGYLTGEILVRPPIALPGPYGFVSDICIQEAWRQHGVGRALFEEMRRWFVARKVKSIELYIAEANPMAAAFWQAMGFRPFLKLMHLDLYAEGN